MKPAATVINKTKMEMVSLLEQDQVKDIQLPTSKRPVQMFTGRFAVQGLLHVSSDAPDEDLLDEMHDFYPLSDASIFPLRNAPSLPTQKVPLLIISRLRIQAYRARTD
jgi:hypothetical protein